MLLKHFFDNSKHYFISKISLVSIELTSTEKTSFLSYFFYTINSKSFEVLSKHSV